MFLLCPHLRNTTHATGGKIPVELFPAIFESFNSPLPLSRTNLAALKNCALVCLYWAERCREHIWRGEHIRIRSFKTATEVNQALSSSPSRSRLVPIIKLIAGIDLALSWSAETPHISHRSTYLAISSIVNREKLVPCITFTRANPRHCGINANLPRNIPPSQYPYTKIIMYSMEFKSSREFAKFLGHYPLADDINCWKVNYHDDSGLILRRNSPPLKRIMACHSDEGTLAMCLSIAKSYPNFVLWRLSRNDRSAAVAILRIFRTIWGDTRCTFSCNYDDPSGVSLTVTYSTEGCSVQFAGFPHLQPAERNTISTLSPFSMSTVTIGLPCKISDDRSMADLESSLRQIFSLRRCVFAVTDRDHIPERFQQAANGHDHSTSIGVELVFVWVSESAEAAFPEIEGIKQVAMNKSLGIVFSRDTGKPTGEIWDLKHARVAWVAKIRPAPASAATVTTVSERPKRRTHALSKSNTSIIPITEDGSVFFWLSVG